MISKASISSEIDTREWRTEFTAAAADSLLSRIIAHTPAAMRFISRPLCFVLTAASSPEPARWRAEASRVTITRDDWGIAHTHGQSDADAVFGMIYAQAEDDFPRIEANYLTAL